MNVAAGYSDKSLAVTSSHFCGAEKQFRFPIEYGNQRPLSSTWTVTGDSTITSLSNAGTITDADGKTVSIVGTDGTTYVEGDSDYTITVGSYQDSADTSASTTVDDWSSYEVERPESL